MLGDVRLPPREHHHGDECLIGLCVKGSHRGRALSGDRGASLKPTRVNPSSGSWTSRCRKIPTRDVVILRYTPRHSESTLFTSETAGSSEEEHLCPLVSIASNVPQRNRA
jgi:hypothetical protein